jgi:hypothetical protein
MLLRKLALSAAAATALAGLTVAPAVADEGPAQPTAAYAGHLVAGPGAVTVKIAYTCSTATVGAMNHLFVAVKQGPDIDTGEHSSSQYAVSFYSTNWKSDAGPNALTCDGAPHVQTVVLKKQPVAFWPPSATQPALHSGTALVQICVFDNVTQFSDEGEPLDGGFAPDYTMQQVLAGNGHS